MPDICMCKGKDHNLCKTCYRRNAIPSEFRQSYFVNPPLNKNKCEYYWNDEGMKILRINN